jgi:5-hydroxyisourate hydrolase-like protein (transthyretin family)
VAWRGKQFAVSHEITLTESEPDAEVTLNFAQPQSHTWLVTDEEGHPLRAAEAKLFFNPQPNHSFELNTYYTDGLGSFTVEGVTPTAGKYSVRISASGYALQELDLNFRKSDPGHIELKPGLPISGRVVDSATGYPLPHAKVQVWGNTAGQQMPQETTTDENGAFSFTTLSQGSCEVRVNEARFQHTDPFGNPLYNESHQAGETNLILRVVPEKWGQLKPKVPETNAPAGAPRQETSRAHHRQRTGSRGEHFV